MWSRTFIQVVVSMHFVFQTTEHRSVNVELSKASLDTMLDSLSKIQEQISSVNQ